MSEAGMNDGNTGRGNGSKHTILSKNPAATGDSFCRGHDFGVFPSARLVVGGPAARKGTTLMRPARHYHSLVECMQKWPVSGATCGHWTVAVVFYVSQFTKLLARSRGQAGTPAVKVNVTRTISRFVKKVTTVISGKVTLTVTRSVTFGGNHERHELQGRYLWSPIFGWGIVGGDRHLCRRQPRVHPTHPGAIAIDDSAACRWSTASDGRPRRIALRLGRRMSGRRFLRHASVQPPGTILVPGRLFDVVDQRHEPAAAGYHGTTRIPLPPCFSATTWSTTAADRAFKPRLGCGSTVAIDGTSSSITWDSAANPPTSSILRRHFHPYPALLRCVHIAGHSDQRDSGFSGRGLGIDLGHRQGLLPIGRIDELQFVLVRFRPTDQD